MNNKIDARKLDCPKPVLMTKKELDKENIKIVEVWVDNDIARENLSRLAHSMDCKFSCGKEGADYKILIEKTSNNDKATDDEAYEEVDLLEADNFKDLTLGFSGDTMGSGDRELGKILMKSYIYTVLETPPHPKSMVFFNTGVRLTCQGSDLLDDIKKLRDMGVEVISCGTCLDYLNLKDKLMVGDVSNMYTIYEKLRDNKKTIVL